MFTQTVGKYKLIIFLILSFSTLVFSKTLSAQCVRTIESKYIVFNTYSIPNAQSFDLLTNFDIIDMLPEHYQVEKVFCLEESGTSTTTKYYSWFDNHGTKESELYDKVVVNSGGIKFYNGSLLVLNDSFQYSPPVSFHDVDLNYLGYQPPVNVPANLDFEDALIDNFSVLYSNNPNVVTLINDSMRIVFNQENQYSISTSFDEHGYIKSEEFIAVQLINDTLAVPKAEYQKEVYYSIQGIPIEKTEYKIYINYAINDVSLLHNNEYLDQAPLIVNEDDIISIGLKGRTNLVDKNITIFPNPAQESLSIHIPEKYEGSFLCSFYTTQGEKIMEQDGIKGPIFSLDIYNLPPGVYICRITSPQLSFSKKIIVQ